MPLNLETMATVLVNYWTQNYDFTKSKRCVIAY